MEFEQLQSTEGEYEASRYSLVTVIVVALLVMMLTAAAVLVYLYLSPLPSTVVNDSNEAGTEVNSSTTPVGFDFPDRGRVKSVNYAEPDPEVFNGLEFPQLNDGAVATSAPAFIPFPDALISDSYEKSFNVTVEAIVAVETHMTTNVAQSMASVQEKAAAGKYIEMFEQMLVAKRHDETGRNLSVRLNETLPAFKAAIDTQKDAELKRLSNIVVQQAARYADLNTTLMNQNDAILIGSIPSQQQLDEIQATATEIAKVNVALSTAIKNISDHIKKNV